MRLIEINWTPTARQLRQFGLICAVALPLLAWLWGGGLWLIGAFLAAGGLLGCIGLWQPNRLRGIFLAMSIVATPIGLVIGELALLCIYFGVFLPIGLAFRILGRDALQRTIDRGRESYWEAKKQPRDAASYYRQS